MRILVSSRIETVPCHAIRSREMQPLTLYCFASVIALVVASCPESKKAHPTSCRLFYNCVPLPNGGYVWVPDKCADGLVFQPYLQLCVLPGDLWTCASPSTPAPSPASSHERAQINYLKPPPASSFLFSDLVDLPLSTDSFSESPDSETTITPYPPDEIEEEAQIDPDKTNSDKDHSSTPTENTLSQNTVGDRTTYPPLLSNLLSHLLKHNVMPIPFESLRSPSTAAESGQQFSTVPVDLKKTAQRHNLLANYLIQNYIQQNNLQTTVISRATEEKPTKAENTTTQVSINDIPPINRNSDENAGLAINKLDGDSNIVLIKDSTGNNEYSTIEEYQSHWQYLNSKYPIAVPCVSNIRLPNTTDCTKYYMCDPATAVVMEYSCPENAAFNKYSRVCDTESRVTCTETGSGNLAQVEAAQEAPTNPAPFEKTCAELGKMKDPSSDFHYFICYASSTFPSQIESIRLACPNSLVFCQSKKFCTTKRLCTLPTK